MNCHFEGSAFGKYSCSEEYFASFDCSTWPIRYLVRSKLSRPTASSDPMLSGRTEAKRSPSDPCLRNLVEKPAYGPKSSERFPSTKRESKCGTDIGGAPTEA